MSFLKQLPLPLSVVLALVFALALVLALALVNALALRSETHRRLLRLKRFTYTINLDHYRSLLGTNSPVFDVGRLLRTKREFLCTRNIIV